MTIETGMVLKGALVLELFHKRAQDEVAQTFESREIATCS